MRQRMIWTNCAGRGPTPMPMLVVDASCLFEVVADGESAERVRSRLAADVDQAAPHLVDVEVMNVVRRQLMLGTLDLTAANQAIDDLVDRRLADAPGPECPIEVIEG